MNAQKRNGLKKHLTVRGVRPELARALLREQRRRGQTLNRTVLDLLGRALGISYEEDFDNGLGEFSGLWTEKQYQEFKRNTAIFEQIDEELWK